ncbi:hypothetical protein HMPREF9072_00942 [Capnocytophaga sp. oral taxon 324 str. F0483]|nr:hypothetical protein HMPREF9072_00942 [Capnocytophaga sp. oral taxon 324 str. F0483]
MRAAQAISANHTGNKCEPHRQKRSMKSLSKKFCFVKAICQSPLQCN